MEQEEFFDLKEIEVGFEKNTVQGTSKNRKSSAKSKLSKLSVDKLFAMSESRKSGVNFGSMVA